MFRWVLLVCAYFFSCNFVTAVVPDTTRLLLSPHDSSEFVVFRNVTPLCLSHTTHWLSQLRQGEIWALKMLDSWTKLPSGGIIGSNNQLGVYDQCLGVSVQDDVAKFQGQYVRSWSRIDIPGEPYVQYDMTNAFCVPSTCTPEEIPLLLQETIGPALDIGISIWGINPLDCHIKESSKPLPTGVIITVILSSIIIGAVILSALAEWRLGEKTPALVRACSFTSTCRSLFNTSKHPADISCLNGIRVGSMLWIILGHHYTQERWQPLSNQDLFATYFIDKPLLMTIANAMPSVDTFFFLSGLLMCVSFLREVSKGVVFDVIKFYIYRYLRIVVPLAFVIILYITSIDKLGDGPLWNNYFYNESRNCKKTWYLTMLFVNNVLYREGFGNCLGQTWYTAVDMQLAWLSPLVLLPLYHSPRAGLQLMTLLILISCFIPFTITYIYHFPMTQLHIWIDIPMEGVPEGGDFWRQLYAGTQSRASPYLCGILFGLYMFKTRGTKVKLSKPVVLLGWTICTAVALTIVYSVSMVYQPGYVYDVLGSAFYAGFHRLGWAAVLIWIVFACTNGFGGVIDNILSWNLLLPLSRMTYSTFLIHMITMLYDSGTTRTISHYSDFDAVHDFFGDLVPTYFLSFLLYVFVEGPIMNLLRAAFSKGARSPKVEKKNLNQEVRNENIT